MSHEYIFNSFKRCYPLHASEAEDWEPLDMTRISVYLKDGGILIYDELFNTINRNVQYDDEEITEERWRQEFKYNLMRLMRLKGLGQVELAELLGVSQGTISNYTCGKSLPSNYMSHRLAKVLDCDEDDLVMVPVFRRRR